ncbi:NnrS family protein [Rhodobacteraceae bacterium F11138]|nr:NnrS family protein [Rhodobacteraceae bacterium F11138]
MSTTSEKMRAWTGPTIFSFGLRPFFLGGAVWAASAMLIWLGMLAGHIDLPTAFDPTAWHAHEFLFGYLSAIIAGFMMTAVPNWTGRLPVVGWPLAGLFMLWVLGRISVGFSAMLPPLLVAIADLSCLGVFVAAMAREIITGKNWRNLVSIGLISVFMVANGIFHWEAAFGTSAAQGYGLRLGVGTAIVLIALVGGRIIPSFTRNWLVQQRAKRLPMPPMQTFDRAALFVLAAAILLWVASPFAWSTSSALLCAGGMHLVRLSRWCGLQTLREPLVLILHIAYLFVPLGAVATAASGFWPNLMIAAPAQHIWMAGAIGGMTLAVMTRATLSHTGQPLGANAATQVLYLCLIAVVLLRFVAGFEPAWAETLHMLSGMCWIASFAGFGVVYGRLLLRPKTRS